jgi:hypothetical protein
MSEPRRLGELLPDVLMRARRLAILNELIETYDAPEDRKAMIMVLYERDLITSDAASLLIDHLELRAA